MKSFHICVEENMTGCFDMDAEDKADAEKRWLEEASNISFSMDSGGYNLVDILDNDE